jgi:hypothetical protein
MLGGGTLFERLARLARNMVLARLIAPDQFGMMAIVLAVVALFEALLEDGIGQAVIQNERGNTPEFLNVAWWLSGIRSVLLFVLAAAGRCQDLRQPRPDAVVAGGILDHGLQRFHKPEGMGPATAVQVRGQRRGSQRCRPARDGLHHHFGLPVAQRVGACAGNGVRGLRAVRPLLHPVPYLTTSPPRPTSTSGTAAVNPRHGGPAAAHLPRRER